MSRGTMGIAGRALAVVAAVTVGFAVGDALATPHEVAATTAQRSTPDFQHSWTLAPGKTLEIEEMSGAIHVTKAAGNQVEVTAWKHAQHSDPDQVTIEEIAHPGGVTVCVRYPGRGNTCEPGGHNHINTNNNDVSVDFEVRLPAGVCFVGRTVNGAVEATGLESDAEGHTVNGTVSIETSGRAEAHTVNGGVRARLGKLGASGPITFETVNGSIVLELPDGAGAEVRARTVHGSIETDFPVTVLRVRHGFMGDRLEGTIGKGGPELEIQ
ncbi:MAG TPA: hypothetical protein VMS88_08815, partial [Terriglobales bacterium]|nr:hypothetical protein [Terriglobales bacterium]